MHTLKADIKSTDQVQFEIAFKNFVFEHRNEFRSCDFSCFIGEIGGNLGFFLGGSILMLIEFTFSMLVPRI